MVDALTTEVHSTKKNIFGEGLGQQVATNVRIWIGPRYRRAFGVRTLDRTVGQILALVSAFGSDMDDFLTPKMSALGSNL